MLNSIDCILKRGASLFVVDVAGEIRQQGDDSKLIRTIVTAFAEFECNRNRH